MNSLLADRILSSIWSQLKHLSDVSYDCDDEDIIIDISQELYDFINQHYCVISDDDEKKLKMYGCEVYVISNTPKEYFKVSRKEKVILKHRKEKLGLHCSVCGLCLGSGCYNFCPCCGSRFVGVDIDES